MLKKQMNEKVAALQETITQEKETRDLWIQRYEKESTDRTSVESQLLKAKSEYKDMQLNHNNLQIQIGTQQKVIQNFKETIKKLQHEVNEAITRAESLERELIT